MDKTQPKLLVAGLGEVLWDMLPDGRQCGGAPANVIFHASKLGAKGLVVSAVGADADGDDLLAFLKGKGIACSRTTVLANRLKAALVLRPNSLQRVSNCFLMSESRRMDMAVVDMMNIILISQI